MIFILMEMIFYQKQFNFRIDMQGYYNIHYLCVTSH